MDYLKVLDQLIPDNSGNVLQQISDTYLVARHRVATSDEVDSIHRATILEHPVVKNPLYTALAQRKISKEHFQTFSPQYLAASTKYFFTDIVPAARRLHTSDDWQEYTQHILDEESTPMPHHKMFEKLVLNCGGQVVEPNEAAQKYASAMMKGYTADSPFAAGYALGVEVQAGYEIALLYYGLSPLFPMQVKRSDFFRVHLGDGQEDEHAEASVALIESSCKNEADFQRAKAGFVQFCDDANAFMTAMYTLQ
jgi:hypothetical protein